MAKRKKSILQLEGSLGYITKNGIEYVRFRKYYNGKQKEFTGKTKEDVEKKL